MNVRKKILIPMVALTFICSVAVLISSILLFSRELRLSMRNKIDVALNVVEHEIEYMIEKAYLAVYAMSSHPELIEALSNNDVETVVNTAFMLKAMSSLDYCVIMDKEGYVITRTHDPDNYGDNAAALPHVRSALSGNVEACLMQGITVPLGASASAPVYDENGSIIGAISLGFILSEQEFVYKLSDLTGCEITFFLNDERVSSTVLNEDGTYALGTKAAEHISSIVLAGESYSGNIELFGQNVLANYSPLYGANDEIIGMLFVGFYTAEDTSKILFFILSGVLITLGVLAVCIVIAMYISGVINQRLDEAQTKLTRTNETNEVQLVFLNAIIKASKIALWEMEVVFGDPVNPNNRIIWTDEFRSLMGYTSEDDFPNVLNSWSDRLHPDDKMRTLKAFANHMLDVTGQTPFDIEYRLLKKNNEYSYYRATGETLRDANGAALRVAGALMDITEGMKNLHNKLDTESTTLQTMLDSILDHIFCKDANYKYTRANKSLLEYHGVNEDDLIGSDDATGLGVPENVADEFRVTDNIVLSEGKIIMAEEYIPAIDGSLRLFETNKIPLLQKGKITGIMGIARDITERKKMEQAAQSANRSKSLFLANMSHEIRTPMNSIIGFADLVQDYDIPSKAKEYIINIQESAKWLLSLVNDILDISKIESGNIELENIPFNLPDIFAHCQSAIIPKATEKGITLFCYAEPSVGKKLLGDPVKLRQVIMNLLSNAIKFTNSGTVKLLASLEKIDETRSMINFEIKDSGIGMSPEQVQKIFEPFKQADESITRKFGGTGLGLTITKNFIELMGGELNVESAPGIGSKFSFSIIFDLIDDTTEYISEKIVVNEFEKPNFNGEVLICEDNHLNQQVICDHLARVGLKTVVASDGSEGVNAVAERIKNNEKPFDLIFMDIHMPVMDGLEAASKISDLKVKTPIVALTANIMSNDIELYKKNGMVDTLGKPFTTSELWKCLIRFIPVERYTVIDESRKKAEDCKTKHKLKINFVKDNQMTYNDLITALGSDDIKTAHRIAHTLKSNAAQIGEAKLRDAAAEAEAVLKEKGQPTKGNLSRIKLELKKILNDLAPLLNEDNVPDNEITDVNKIRDLIETLEPFLIDNSTKSLKLIDELRAVPGTGELVYQIEEYNFKLALTALESLKKEVGISE